MKAWSVTDDGDERTFVWADTRSEAKSLAKLEDGFEDTPFIKIRAVRFPDLDGEPPAGHYWDDDRVRLILVRDYCWYCADADERECQYCVANEYCER